VPSFRISIVRAPGRAFRYGLAVANATSSSTIVDVAWKRWTWWRRETASSMLHRRASRQRVPASSVTVLMRWVGRAPRRMERRRTSTRVGTPPGMRLRPFHARQLPLRAQGTPLRGDRWHCGALRCRSAAGRDGSTGQKMALQGETMALQAQ
jgi:hypothetical protein